MAQYRTQTRIIADVLAAARDANSAGDGVGITTLLRKGNLSYSRLSKLVSELVGAGLLVEMNEEQTSRYKITQKGISFLRTCNEFQDFAQSFGLNL